MSVRLLAFQDDMVTLAIDRQDKSDLERLFAVTRTAFARDAGKDARNQHFDHTFIAVLREEKPLPEPVWQPGPESSLFTARMSLIACEDFCNFIHDLYKQSHRFAVFDPRLPAIIERLDGDLKPIYDRIVPEWPENGTPAG